MAVNSSGSWRRQWCFALLGVEHIACDRLFQTTQPHMRSASKANQSDTDTGSTLGRQVTILYYPLSTGRNLDEMKRIIVALQKADKDNVATPANWRPGDDCIVPTAGSCGTAKDRMTNPGNDVYCLDWFMCSKREKKWN